MKQKDYLIERIGARVDFDIYISILEISNKYNIKPTIVLREIVHEAIRENHEIIKRGMIQKFNGTNKI